MALRHGFLVWEGKKGRVWRGEDEYVVHTAHVEHFL